MTNLPNPEAFARGKAQAAREAARVCALLDSARKNAALEAVAVALEASCDALLAANALDVQAGERAGLGAKLDRLVLTRERVAAICRDIRNVIKLPDPIGCELQATKRPNGMLVSRVSCPLGVVGIIYESRPNVTVDASVLCLKSGNAVVLKGGSDALHSNRAIVQVIREALAPTAIPTEAVQLLDSAERAVTSAFLGLKGLLDVIIPRGGLSLIRFTQEHSRVPVIETGASVVHAYVDKEADLAQTLALVHNAKVRRPAICGALDVLLLHQDIALDFAEALAARLAGDANPVRVHVAEPLREAFAVGLPTGQLLALDPDHDFDTEFLDYEMTVTAVASLEEALEHIHQHSLKHTEAIYTSNPETAEKFLASVDAACVMHNTSTQFTDGAEFGLGAEIGISTQKLHVRGPFALEGLTSMKWLVRGQGQVRP